MISKENRNFGLDITRALAIGLVLINHLAGIIFNNNLSFLWYIAYLGVDLFFALSGFLIGKILIQYCDHNKGVLTPKQTWIFLVRRWFRTVPLYYVILFSAFFLEKWLTGISFDWKYLLWLQSWEGPRPGFFGISWSLCIEEWFYLTFALGFCFFSHLFKGNAKTKLFFFTIAYITAFTIIRWRCAPSDYTTFTSTIFRLDSIGYGVLMACYHYYYSLKSKKALLLLVMLSVILWITGIIFLFTKINMNLYYSFAGAGLAVFVYCMGLMFNTIKKSSPVIYLSKISYSVYIVNLHVIYMVLWYGPASGIWKLVIALITVVSLSALTYRFVEKPSLRFRDKYFSNNIK